MLSPYSVRRFPFHLKLSHDSVHPDARIRFEKTLMHGVSDFKRSFAAFRTSFDDAVCFTLYCAAGRNPGYWLPTRSGSRPWTTRFHSNKQKLLTYVNSRRFGCLVRAMVLPSVTGTITSAPHQSSGQSDSYLTGACDAQRGNSERFRQLDSGESASLRAWSGVQYEIRETVYTCMAPTSVAATRHHGAITEQQGSKSTDLK